MDKNPFERPPVECAHTACGYHAIAKVKTKTGWASFCWVHYEKHFHIIAIENCLDRGLNSPEQCRQWLKENRPKIRNFSDAETA